MSHWLVLKFGGTSVASRDRWETIASRARAGTKEGLRPLVVCSAVSGVTNRLEALPTAALDGRAAELIGELRAVHAELASALDVSLESTAAPVLDELEQLAKGIAQLDEVSPRTRARILAAGELMSTRIGAAFLAAQGIDAGWLDARTALRALPRPGREALRWLSAVCDDDHDPALAERLATEPHQVLVTQGFLAGTDEGETVVLGRGGSDTSAAYFAAKLGAARCEIWTDVPGMFTADPRQVPEARLLRRLDYDEAQEIASTGAKVLHPRAVGPVKRHRIPLLVRYAPDPSIAGTVIRDHPAGGAPQVKALSTKKRVTLVSMDNLGMWHEAGFLGDVFAVFKAQGISVDLVSTSESNVTVTLDPGTNALDRDVLERLAEALEPFCKVGITEGLAAVSLVGIGIRSILHRLGPAFEQFEEQPVHLVSQAASDLNLTFVVDADREERVLRRLHGELFQSVQESETFGPTWRDLFAPTRRAEASRPEPWWSRERDRLLEVAGAGTPTYAYHADTIRTAAAGLRSITAVDRVFYAMKANSHPDVLQVVADEGLGFECVSPGELARVAETVDGPLDGRLLFTPNFAPRSDYEAGVAAGAFVTVDNLHPLEHWGGTFADREIMVRVDVGVARGHHKHVKTAGARSKFGLDPEELPRAAELARQAGARIVGLHAHSGSGIRTPEAWQEVATRLAEHARTLPDVRRLDVGGGLGVPEKPGQPPLDLDAVNDALGAVRHEFGIEELWIEPGRFVVAESGVLLATVTQIKRKRDVTWIGMDAGMHTLIRPALYGAWHEIVNLTRLGEDPSISAQVVGPICETGDFLGRNRRLPETREGDVLLVATAGAYGRTMASEYNLRGVPREVLV